jgi:hypothetical protein
MPTEKAYIPDNFRQVLVEFVTAYLLDWPGTEIDDISKYAVEYFTTMQKNQRKVGIDAATSDPLTDSDEDEIAKKHIKHRRMSVCAEQYDPEKEDEAHEKKIVYPKSDVQRERLWNSVKDILLFRSLDKEQVRFPRYF